MWIKQINGHSRIVLKLYFKDISSKAAISLRETPRNAYMRGKKYLDEYRNKAAKSVFWQHCQELHKNENREFRMRVTGLYRNDAML